MDNATSFIRGNALLHFNLATDFSPRTEMSIDSAEKTNRREKLLEYVIMYPYDWKYIVGWRSSIIRNEVASMFRLNITRALFSWKRFLRKTQRGHCRIRCFSHVCRKWPQNLCLFPQKSDTQIWIVFHLATIFHSWLLWNDAATRLNFHEIQSCFKTFQFLQSMTVLGMGHIASWVRLHWENKQSATMMITLS